MSLEGESGRGPRGAVIIPAFNEAAVIKRSLIPLSRSAVEGQIELIVVCNGCSDDTATRARTVPGATVIELEQGSKPAALNVGDDVATVWPRVYLDADIRVSAEAVLAVLDRLRVGDVLLARPPSKYDTAAASRAVKAYYRARNRISRKDVVMWGAGVYGISQQAHERFGRFPAITGDDLFVDLQFAGAEKAVVITDPAIVTTPADLRSLLAVLRRGYRGEVELPDLKRENGVSPTTSGLRTAVAVARTARGPRSLVDAVVYLAVSSARRVRYRKSQAWARDDSSRNAVGGGFADRDLGNESP